MVWSLSLSLSLIWLKCYVFLPGKGVDMCRKAVKEKCFTLMLDQKTKTYSRWARLVWTAMEIFVQKQNDNSGAF